MIKIESKIETNDGDIFSGVLDEKAQRFAFPPPFEDVKDRLQIRKISDAGIVISYVYEDDYEPKILCANIDEPLVIEDYKGYEPYKIVIKCSS